MSAPSPLAPYASRPEASRGRLFAQPASPTRSAFQRDRDRIIHCGAFRRLKYKTQVFVYHEGDYYRTRLTHSIEVAQIARSLARTLDLNEDLAEAVALAHDLGHTPFGHAGEAALNSAMAPYGGFDHNEQTFRILTFLERRYAEFDGLNLTWETLEGTVKHNGPLTGPNAKCSEVPASIAAYDAQVALELHTQSGPEAQVAAIADDIAYNTHDIDDGLRAGLFTTEDLAAVPLVGPVFREVLDAYPGLEQSRLIYEAVRRLIDRMVNDCLAETRVRLEQARPESLEALRALPAPVVAISREMRQNDRALKAFLFERMYRHRRVNRMTARARKVVAGLFERYLADPGLLPREWRDQVEGTKALAKARVVADYIAGMTDRFALEAHRNMFGKKDKK